MKNNPRIIKEKCPKCGHGRMWSQRENKTGVHADKFYIKKCAKCTYIERV